MTTDTRNPSDERGNVVALPLRGQAFGLRPEPVPVSAVPASILSASERQDRILGALFGN